jgi:hypothetical protein
MTVQWQQEARLSPRDGRVDCTSHASALFVPFWCTTGREVEIAPSALADLGGFLDQESQQWCANGHHAAPRECGITKSIQSAQALRG